MSTDHDTTAPEPGSAAAALLALAGELDDIRPAWPLSSRLVGFDAGLMRAAERARAAAESASPVAPVGR